MEAYGTYFHGISKTADSWNAITSSRPNKYDLRFFYWYASFFTFPDRPGRRACHKDASMHVKQGKNLTGYHNLCKVSYLRESKIREALMRGRRNGENRFLETEINEVMLLLLLLFFIGKNGHDGLPVKPVVVVVPMLIRSGE